MYFRFDRLKDVKSRRIPVCIFLNKVDLTENASDQQCINPQTLDTLLRLDMLRERQDVHVVSSFICTRFIIRIHAHHLLGIW